ncbi:MAG: gamma-glutamyltransferase [Planctomycetota bacterium]
MPSRCLALPLLVGAIVLPQSQAIQTPVDLSPARWDQRERERLESLGTVMGQDKAPAHAANGKGIITATSSVLAVKAGLVALDQGGTAADAALTTAITQVCLAAGSWVSYAGIFTMVYYDAESRTLANLNAAFNTVLDEDAPLTIPAASEGPSGRTALVPGFIAGVEAAHHRFGKLPFAQLFQPAIHYAEQGFPLHAIHAAMLAERRAVLTRLPQTRRLFTRADGQLHAQGDVFHQPELAETLRQIAAQGARFMYRGPWAEHFVAAVQRDGGKLTRRDAEHYEPIWRGRR